MKITQPIISDLDETDKESLLCGGSFDISPCNSFTEEPFTRAFSDEGRYITRFEMHALEPNFYTMDMARKIIAELEIMCKSENADASWFRKLAEYLEKIVNVAPQGSFISVTN